MSKKTAKTLLVAAALGASLAGVVAVVAATSGGGGLNTSPAAEVAESSQPERRTVLLSNDRMPRPSPEASRLHALRASGQMPGRPSAATVLTDEDCAPDARGISRCLNRIRLASGETLSVRHPHQMMQVPCLSPGERVTVRPA